MNADNFQDSPIPCAANFNDALGKLGMKFQAMRHNIHGIFHPLKIAARAYTVRCYAGATWALEEAIEKAPPGNVLVVDGGGHPEAVLMGGLMSHRARKRGLAGAIIDGAVRDIEEIRKARWPVFAAAVTPRSGTHDPLGEMDILITCGGVLVEPGDWIVADEDGVVVVPTAVWNEALTMAQDICIREQFFETRLEEGFSLAEAAAKWNTRSA